MRIKGRIVEIRHADGCTVFIVEGLDEHGIGRRAEIPTNLGFKRFSLGDAAEIEIEGPPDHYTYLPPKSCQ